MRSPTTRIPIGAPGAVPIFEGAGLSHRGTIRAENEDAILTDPTGILWAVADGMGAYGHGDLASDLVIGALSQIDHDAVAAGHALCAALTRANADIQVQASKSGFGQIGATVVALMLQVGFAHIVWAGDCRAYLWRDNALRLLTRDHTVVQDMVDAGALEPAKRDTHPEAHVVTRAVGYEPELELDEVTVPIVPGDWIILCSDGLTGAVGEGEMTKLLQCAVKAETLCKAIMTAALTNGASDNVSVVAVCAKGLV